MPEVLGAGWRAPMRSGLGKDRRAFQGSVPSWASIPSLAFVQIGDGVWCQSGGLGVCFGLAAMLDLIISMSMAPGPRDYQCQ